MFAAICRTFDTTFSNFMKITKSVFIFVGNKKKKKNNNNKNKKDFASSRSDR